MPPQDVYDREVKRIGTQLKNATTAAERKLILRDAWYFDGGHCHSPLFVFVVRYGNIMSSRKENHIAFWYYDLFPVRCQDCLRRGDTVDWGEVDTIPNHYLRKTRRDVFVQNVGMVSKN